MTGFGTRRFAADESGGAHPGPAARSRSSAPTLWARMRQSRTTRWTFWKYNWIIYHRTIAVLERARAHVRGDLLDVGCGDRPFAWVFDGHVTRYVGTDLYRSICLDARPPDLYSRSEALPFRDVSFDTVLGLSMLTYVPEPLAMLREANRVLKPGGILMLEFTQMAPLLYAPWDFFRFTRYGAAYLLERAGFESLEFIPIAGLWTQVGMTLIAGLNRMNRGPLRVLTELPVRVLYAVLQPLFALLDRAFFDPCDVVGHLVVARKARAAGDEDPARALAAATRPDHAAASGDGSRDGR